MKPFQIILHNDLDGGVSGIVIINYLMQKYGKNVKYKTWFGSYHNVDMYTDRILEKSNEFEHIYIADISVNPTIAKLFPNKQVTLLDHHPTVAELNGFPGCIVDISGKHCGASLCYKHLLKKENFKFDHLTKLVAIALDYDLWHHKLPNKLAKNVNSLYFKYWGEKFIERYLNGFDGFNEEETTFLNEKWEEIENQIKTVPVLDVMESSVEHKNKVAIIINDKNYEVNELCEHALKNLGYHVVLAIDTKKFKISGRIDKYANEKGLNIGEFLKQIGVGSGHPLAAGAFYSDENHIEEITEKLVDKVIELSI